MKSLTKNQNELKQIIQDLEKLILAKAYEWARYVFKVIVEYIDSLIKQYRNKSLSIEHKRGVWYVTSLGKIRVERRQYIDQQGNYYYPLDLLFGMKKYQHTAINAQQSALELAASVAFRQAEQILRKMTAIDISHQTIHRLLSRTADKYLEEQDRNRRWFHNTGEIPPGEDRKIDRLFIEADGVMLSLQRSQARKAEVKLGIAYEGWDEVGKDRYKTINKTCYADILDGDSFWSDLTLKLHRKYDLASINDIVIGGDGSSWIKDGVDYFRGRFQLCRYHLNREIRCRLGANRNVVNSLYQALNRGDIDNVCQILKEAALTEKGDKSLEIKRLYRYIKANASGLVDYRHDIADSQYLRRTGAIEGNIDKLIVRRMKNQGMSWTPQGIRRMLSIRLLIYEGKLNNQLKSLYSDIKKFVIPPKRINRVIDKTIEQNYVDYFTAGLPALYGPYPNKPWVRLLKSLTRMGI